MNVFSLAATFVHHLGSLQPDDSGIALIALLAGMIGGYRITGWHAQMKARRAKIPGKPQSMSRKRD